MDDELELRPPGVNPTGADVIDAAVLITSDASENL
jgi:hypothetical protein